MNQLVSRAVSDCLVLCAYSERHPLEAAAEYVQSLRRDPLWDHAEVEQVESLVLRMLARLQRSDVEGSLK